MRRLALLVLLVASLLAWAWSRRPHALEFESSFDAALARARADDAWVVVHLRRTDRPLGEKLDSETLDARVVREFGHDGFVHVRVDAAREPELAARLAGPGGALATAVTDERGDLVALLPGFVEAEPFAAFLKHVRVQRIGILAARRKLEADASDVAARIDLARHLKNTGALARAEAEIERVCRELDAAGVNGPFAAELPRALELRAELLLARGQDAQAADLRRELDARYPAAPDPSPAKKKE